jgi:hypothetical protein
MGKKFRVKGKGKGRYPVRPEGPDGGRGIAQSFLTSALEGGGWSAPRPGPFTPGKDPVPIVQEVGWAPGPVWTNVKNLAPPEFEPRTVQPVASRYTDWAIPAPRILEYSFKMEFVADCYKMKMFHIYFSLQFSSLVVRQVYFQLVSRPSIMFMNFCFNSRIKALNSLWCLALLICPNYSRS